MRAWFGWSYLRPADAGPLDPFDRTAGYQSERETKVRPVTPHVDSHPCAVNVLTCSTGEGRRFWSARLHDPRPPF
jgi:hypothetical protein